MIRDAAVIEAETDRDLLTPRYTEEALRFLNEEPTKPFFLYMAYSYPMTRPRFSALSGQIGAGRIRGCRAGDRLECWRSRECAEEKGSLADTLILFTSDHGPCIKALPVICEGEKGPHLRVAYACL